MASPVTWGDIMSAMTWGVMVSPVTWGVMVSPVAWNSWPVQRLEKTHGESSDLKRLMVCSVTLEDSWWAQ